MNKNVVLLKNLLLSTSRWNTYRHCRDKKKRGRLVGSAVGQAILYLLLMCYCVASCIGYGAYGLTGSIPVLCALVISALSFFLTFFKTNGYLFHFREYDMLMSLPFEPKSIAACKFLDMYVKSLPCHLSVSVSMLAGYGILAKPPAAVYPVWLLLSLFLPVIPMLGAAFLGFLVARAGAGFRNKTLVQTALTILFLFACFGLRFFLQDMFANNRTGVVLSSISDATGRAGGVYLPAGWFVGAVTELRLSQMLLLIGASALLFELVFIPVGRSYRRINSALRSHAAAGRFVMTKQKCRSPLRVIAFKEFRRMIGSTVYLTNAAFGELLCLVAGVAMLFLDADKVIRAVLRDAPLTKETLYPAIPLIVYFFIGMVATTAITPSLEGKNYWIVQSLPIRKRTLYQGKMLFNLYLTVPVTLFTTAAFCLSAKAPPVSAALYLATGVCLCAFSTAWGCVCGIRHMRLDWENEIEVVKQGAAVTVYLLPNMFVTMGLIVLVVYLGTVTSPDLVSAILLLAVAALAALSYLRVLALTKE